MSIYDECLAIYDEAGQEGVFQFVKRKYPNVEWRECKPCEIESPIHEGACLVCGSNV